MMDERNAWCRPRLLSVLLVALAGCLTLQTAWSEECGVARDFLAMDLGERQTGDAQIVARALELAYPGLAVDLDKGAVTTEAGASFPFVTARRVTGKALLEDATLGDQFVYRYPLAFSLEERKTPFFDPGRVRNEPFFRHLFFDSKGDARKSLVKISYKGKTVTASFVVTRKHCVDAQLKAALSEIASYGAKMDRFFKKTGGGFSWRVIAGTNRLSSHSFGSAVDVNTDLGKYWKWTGAREGQVGDYANEIPKELVGAMERRGFIWGGKWNHFDGMHFEYRPELILFARLKS
ncbi:M15 family metallopeptidase [uncultured Cohaesibacter sp.]|uniref:M15 family metallopeptidase n=1 Tax=uncultured Cohaesibacter sp. TaxID=1002546 RepID=UPI0029C91558|nr:M15 family metallopeptidase [uncultured Cohaesibacter sp.]